MSECLPIVVGVGCSDTYGPTLEHQAAIHPLENELVLCLKSRKNRQGSLGMYWHAVAPLAGWQALGQQAEEILLVC